MTALFVSGTGTGVGKTRVGVHLLRALRRSGHRVLGLKPIETGVHGPADPASDGVALSQAAGQPAGLGVIYTLRLAASPHLAAAHEGVRIDEGRVLSGLRPLLARMDIDLTLVEGAGGLRVPLRPGYEMIHLCHDLALPALLVARAGLGTLNETLLSLEALAHRGVPLVGVVLSDVQPDSDPRIVADNLDYLRQQGVPVLGLLPHQPEEREAHTPSPLDLDLLLSRGRTPGPPRMTDGQQRPL